MSDPNECKTCDGERYIEEGPRCSKPASDCCGGCFTSVPCPDCNAEEYEEFYEPDTWDEDPADPNSEVDWEVKQ